jgi:hypothetical protein
MQQSLIRLSPALFGIALICFFLPWVNFTCAGQNYATLTGLDLATGTTVRGPNNADQKTDSEGLALLVLMSSIAGLYVGFLKDKDRETIVLGSGIVGLLALGELIWMKLKIENDLLKKSEGMVKAEFTTGFWIALVCFVTVIALNAYIYLQLKRQTQGLPT